MKIIATPFLLLGLFASSSSAFWQRCFNASNNGLVQCDANDNETTLISNTAVVISDCTFLNCPTLSLNSPTTMTNVTFDSSYYNDDSHFHGGALGVWSKVTLSKCTFKNINAGNAYGSAIYIDFSGNLTGDSLLFQNNTAYIGVVATRGYTKFTNTYFYYNNMAAASAHSVFTGSGYFHWINGSSIWDPQWLGNPNSQADVWLQNYTDTLLENIVIEGAQNSAIVNLGARSFFKNVTINNQYGGTCFMTQYNDALIECTNCVCSNSYSLLGGGGAILSTSNGNVTLINSTISNVTALETSGITYGACTVSSLSWTYLINLVISNCINEYGGAIYNSGYLYASNITVSNSTAIYGGGVLYNDLGGVADIVNSSFCNNTATSFQGNGGGYGGAIFSTGLTSLSNVVISNNTAVYGGGIYTTATAADTLVTSIGIYQLFTNNILYLNDSVLIAGNNASADGGGLYMDGISKIHIGFSNLTVTNNNANGFGNAMYLNQEESNGMNGGVVVSSSASSSGGLVAIVNGTVHVRDVNFGEMLRRQGIVSKLSLSKFEGSNAKVSFLNESQILSLNNSMLDTSGIIPDIQIQSQDVFGNIFQNISVFDPVILQATLLNPDNYSTLIGETVKGILNQNTYTVLFNGLAIKSLRGQEVVQFSLLTTQQNLGYLQYNLTFNLPVCSNTTSILVASGEDSIGRTIYQCLPALAVDSNIRIGFAVFSIILIFISGGFGAFAHFNSNFRIYKSAAPIFTNLITFGCLLQLSSIIPQITANFVQCMLREWFEFIGFVFVLGSLVLKTDRIYNIFTKGAKAKNLSNRNLLIRLSMLVIAIIVFLAVWSGWMPYLVHNIHVSPPNGWIQTDACSNDKDPGAYFPTASVIMHILIELVAAYLAYGVRDVPSQFNESKSVGLITYNWILFGGVLYPIAQFLPVSPNIQFVINVLRVILPAFSTIGILHFEKAYLIIWRPDLANQKPITETNTGAIGKRMPHQSSLFGLVNTSDIRLKGAVRPVAALNSFLDRSRLGGSSSIPEAGTNSGALGTSSHPNSRNNHQSSRGGGGGETPSSNGVGGGQRESVVSALGLTHPKAIRNPSALFGGTTSQINTNNDPLVSLPPTDNPLQWDQLYTPSAQSIHIAPTSSSAPQISVKTPALVGSKHVPLIERESSLLRRQMMESNASGLDAKGKRLRSGSSGSKLVLADVSAAGMINDTSNLSVAEGGEGGEPSSNIMASMALASTNIVMLSMIGMSDGEPVEAAVKTEAMNDQNVLSKPRRKEVWEQVDE